MQRRVATDSVNTAIGELVGEEVGRVLVGSELQADYRIESALDRGGTNEAGRGEG